MKYFFARLLILIVCLPFRGFAIDIPTDLTLNELSEVTEILGFSTSSKFLTNPYALGGYSGFEIGFSTEFVNTADLSSLGAGASKESTFQFNRLTFGKGLYNDIDGFFHFIPFSSSNEISDYGGMIKWSFFQSNSLPFSVSVLGHTSTINIEDLFINEVIGWNLIGGFNLTGFAIYFGGGHMRSRSAFSRSILDASIDLDENGTLITRNDRTHSLAGLHININKFFLAAQIDRYEQPTYSGKIGWRF